MADSKKRFNIKVSREVSSLFFVLFVLVGLVGFLRADAKFSQIALHKLVSKSGVESPLLVLLLATSS
jgi:hypothetical protein